MGGGGGAVEGYYLSHGVFSQEYWARELGRWQEASKAHDPNIFYDKPSLLVARY